uniref:AB hydrolase-1 domain-containing protein n=1 Tax=Oryza meridionalis TaxID=40149 RepID=A0A0E0CW36_9ORYZ
MTLFGIGGKTITTMGASLSLVPLLDYFARREFAAAGLSPGAITLPYPGGGGEATCTVHYWASTGEPRLPPLLLVHGFGPRATWQWRCQVGPLSRHFHLIVPDLIGFGGSSYGGESAASPPSEATQAAALAALLDALPGMKGRRVAVAGTSYGGFVAYWLARTAGAGRVGPVVIASSDLLKTAADDRGFLKRAGDGWSGVEEVLLPAEPAAMRKLIEMASYRPPPPVLMPDFILRDFIQKLFTENREQLIQLFKGITVGTDKFPVTPISQEVLIVWGEQDQLFPVEKAYAVQSSLDGKARVEIISKTGHAPQLEDPTRFNKILLDFLLATHNCKPDPSSNGASQ